jgi:hypothetical protein
MFFLVQILKATNSFLVGKVFLDFSQVLLSWILIRVFDYLEGMVNLFSCILPVLCGRAVVCLNKIH